MVYPAALLKKWNVSAKKQLGQNFLADPSVSQKIIERAGITPEDIVLEIGPGLGALTLPLSSISKKVYAVETDSRIIPILQDELTHRHIKNVSVMHQSILDTDISQIAKQAHRTIIVVGNLPYNISSQILVLLINSRRHISRAVLMFQKELSLRIQAKPGCRDYSRLSVMLQYCADIRTVTTVKASAFFPQPKIDSEVLGIEFKQKIPFQAASEPFLFNVIKAAFGQRRKTLKNSLAGSALPLDAHTAAKALTECRIDPARRAETLTVEEFVRLADTLIHYAAA